MDSGDREYCFFGSVEGEGSFEAEYDSLGYLLNDFTLMVRLDGEGDWKGKEHVLSGFPVTLKPD